MTSPFRPPAPRRSLRALAAPAVLLLVTAAAADEPSGSVSFWGSAGPGQVDDHRASSGGANDSWVVAQAIGSYAHASGRGVTGSTDADVAIRAEAQSLTSYQLNVAHDAGSTATWSASGSIEWDGRATVSTELDADASACGTSILVFSGDLQLTGDGGVAANSSGATAEVTWEFSLTPSYKRKSTRAQHANEDTVNGGTHGSSSGSGASVRVDVASYAKGEITIDTNALGFGMGTAKLATTTRGQLMLSVTVDTTGGSTGGDGPQTGPGADDTGPTTPGGGPSGGVITPRWKRFKVVVDGNLPPESEEGDVEVSSEYPEQPKDVRGPDGAQGSDD